MEQVPSERCLNRRAELGNSMAKEKKKKEEKLTKLYSL